jgi:hypothetical protein
MVAPIVMAAGGAAYTSANKEGSLLNQLIKLIIVIVILALVVFLIITVALTITYWDEIAVFFTTGLIGWLNPFDSPDGDISPSDIAATAASDAVSGAIGGTVAGHTRVGGSMLLFPFRYLWNRLW